MDIEKMTRLEVLEKYKTYAMEAKYYSGDSFFTSYEHVKDLWVDLSELRRIENNWLTGRSIYKDYDVVDLNTIVINTEVS